ncbi:LysR family transcriptional regulator [Thiospirochaeta perfilievii]|uniref:LysR family transcriptional regulator n=1 Tax=Thiospirochaeta perfilievii TaxID=252967 RepID=A0A5C1Q9X9_9SPIO|nr:selenium metabolism-associated LysR family transcriptional regulator [Thiospirochaeta perfilievii]QEN03454.1 LysR family transcriptional regulator [Thiospirochaeta perfilievii]
MKTSYLRTFIEVVNLQSFSKAADKLCLTQPAITKQIKSLEKDFGIVLIIRTNDIILTKEGKEFYKYATTILNKEEELYAKFSKNNRDLSGKLTIYSSSLPANYLLDKILSDFLDKHNNINFHIKKTDSKDVYEKVISGVTNFGFTGMKLNKPNIESIEISKDQLVLALSTQRATSLPQGEISIKTLLEQDFIIRENGSATFKTFEEALKKKNYTLNNLKIKGIVGDNEIIKKMILRGVGVSVMSRLSIEKEINEGLITPLTIKDMDLQRSVYYIYHTKKYFTQIENKFREFLQKDGSTYLKY